MPLPGSIADIAQKSAVLLLAGTTGKTFDEPGSKCSRVCLLVYYMVNIGVLVNRRMELKKEGKLQEELVSLRHGCGIVCPHTLRY